LIAMLGNLARDLFDDRPPHVGGGPYHVARALRSLHSRAQLYARCARADYDALVMPVAQLGTPVRYVPGEATATFRISYDGEVRLMVMEAVGDTWTPADVPELPDRSRWVHVAPLARSDFPADTLAALARGGRRLSLDGQGLVRVPEAGELKLDSDYDPAMLAHVQVLKLAEEEAEVLGDPAALPVREVLVTHGVRGSTVYVSGVPERVPAFGIDADSTGAGDAFSIAYVAARSAGLRPVPAARRATSVVADMLADWR
jgi:sugar/nucleoside kinase (ribokinase family)